MTYPDFFKHFRYGKTTKKKPWMCKYTEYYGWLVSNMERVAFTSFFFPPMQLSNSFVEVRRNHRSACAILQTRPCSLGVALSCFCWVFFLSFLRPFCSFPIDSYPRFWIFLSFTSASSLAAFDLSLTFPRLEWNDSETKWSNQPLDKCISKKSKPPLSDKWM